MVTDRQKGKYKYGGQADRIMNRQILRQNYGETCKHTPSKKQKQGHTDKQTNTQTKKTSKEIKIGTDRQKHGHTNKQK